MARGTFPQQSRGDIKLFIRASPVYFNIRRRLKSNLRTRRRGADDEWIDDAAAEAAVALYNILRIQMNIIYILLSTRACVYKSYRYIYIYVYNMYNLRTYNTAYSARVKCWRRRDSRVILTAGNGRVTCWPTVYA